MRGGDTDHVTKYGQERGQQWHGSASGRNHPTRVRGGQQEWNASAKPYLPKMHTEVEQWSRKTCLYTLQIFVCINYNVQISFQKVLSIVFFKPPQTHMYILYFLPLKMMSCMCHFGTLHRKKWIRFFFFCSGSNLHLILYKCIILYLFFCFLQSEVSVNAQEQTSSTRL